jgi:dienelactone hydrolase
MTYAGLQKFAVNIVAIPDGGVPFLNVGFAGFIGSVTGMNARQIAIGEMGGRGEGQWDGVPMAFLVRTALERAGTLDEALVVFRDAPRTCEYYYVVSDAKLPDARGLYCTPKTFGTVAPGERHERLPTPIADAVLLSADERYRYLVERVQDGYGKFGPAEALKMMERPVAMDSNLHCVLFDAAQSDAYVAIAADPGTERYQACFQPYARINLRAIIDFRPATETPSPLQGEGRGEGPAERDSASAPSVPTPGPEHAEGVISAAQVRPMKPTDDPALAELLKQFEPPPGEFAWSMDRQISSNTYDVYDLRFPSPVTTDTPENNTVCCEYFCCRGDQQRPAVIVLHILDGKFRESRLVCNALAARGIDAVLLKMAYYGPRRPKEPERARRLMQDLPTLIDGARQSAMDARRLAGWLQAQPQVDAQRIGILGISLGGFVAALTSGVDGGFWRSAFILSGGNLEQILRSPAREVRSVRDAIQAAGLTIDDVAARIALIEPCRYAGRIDCRTVLLINTESDPIIPRENVQALADAIGGVDIQWYPGDHYALLWHVLDILGRVEDHFAKP